ncbi:alpha,alpha-trehalose-phosphate synthase (UDP-forming) [Corynebacterium variabile]|uniref:alpha,alpha-trehalose-phosphate synthase (ADP-forming) n=4 Tax=Corynebacterium variabile TaxID=1727 RepID=A0A4Y4BZH8_9CORY|nr:trehalose-6-phosphate synthase [Corynebacterium variabile]AEK35877.1 alpha,alpha-trehalose-phosphate synthase [Corynebacterium variabile DSM 44702]MDN6240229.1 trehalose-6-phosphate synthase [Corynebacterium variabile]MDN6476436.1 trehalose-6-phosphate synthase [Corynebacterium variabile]MDN6536922.1 trehalose-6-phosphate synthase [Corynebacterium variabile]MDN6660395.1 trehalose-6-phosphate synthase [Corynebacterium variabile]
MAVTPSDMVVVANRLPVDRTTDRNGETVWTTSPGGLVTALRPVLESSQGCWVGWPGTTADTPDEEIHVADMPEGAISLLPVNMSTEEFTTYYEGFSNDTLWPLYHDVIVHPEFHRSWWRSYVTVNRRFAEAASEAAAEGATVWVQDYQLHLVPGMLRELRPDLRIGFFLHIPFPTPELFRQLPWRWDVLLGTLGSDLIGFHTPDSAWNFLYTLRALGADVTFAKVGSGDACGADTGAEGTDEEGVSYIRGARLPRRDAVAGTVHVEDPDGSVRDVQVGVFPISIDSAGVAEKASAPETIAAASALRRRVGSPGILLAGVDRLDYTKGILQRLKALEQLLDRGQLDADNVCLIQVATPSRERIDSYQRTRNDVELAVSRINGRHGSLGHTVVHYTHASLPFDEVVALYAAADVMLVTALKDGMNLVAKEYVAAHSDGSGALVLSEFTGAATQLTEGYLCNPYDVESTANAIMKAIESPEDDRRERMTSMWDEVRVHDVHAWARRFLKTLADVK